MNAVILGKDAIAYGVDLAEVPLYRAPARLAADAWSRAEAANSADAYRMYLKNFPEAHHDEATVAYRNLRIPELDAEVSAAIAAKDSARADTALAEWTTIDAANPAVEDASRRVVDLKIDELLATADKALSVANKEHLGELRDAQAAIVRAAGLTNPDDSRIAKRTKRLAQVKSATIASQVAEARGKAARGDFYGAIAELDSAATLDASASDSKAIEDARATVEHLRQLSEEKRRAPTTTKGNRLHSEVRWP